MKNLHLTTIPALKTENIHLAINLEQSIRSDLDLGLKANKITIHTNKINAFHDARIAIFRDTKLYIDAKKIPVTTFNTLFDKNLFLYSLARNETDERTSITNCQNASLKLYPMKMSKDELMNKVRSFQMTNSKKKTLLHSLNKFINVKQQEILKFHVFTEYAGVEVDLRPLNEVNDLDAPDYLTFLACGPGVGKTVRMKSLFNKECELHNESMWINGSRNLTNSFSSIKNDKRHYDRRWNESDTKGVYGVALRLLLNDNYHEIRKNSHCLFVDELEDVLDLLSSSIVGDGTLSDRIKVNNNLIRQLKSVSYAVLADAFPSKNTIEYLAKIAKECGKKFRIFTHTPDREKEIIKVMSPGLNDNLTKTLLQKNTRVFSFCDDKHKGVSKFDARFDSITNKGNPDKYVNKSVKIDSAFTHTEQAKKLSDPDSFVDKYNLIFGNAAIKNGFSITHPDFKHVSLFLHGTNVPTDIMQVIRRPRNVQTIYLSSAIKDREHHTVADLILNNMLCQDLKNNFTRQKLEYLMNDETLQLIARRIAFKNEMRINYEFTLLTMLHQQGHPIEYIENKEQNREGNESYKQSLIDIKASYHLAMLATDLIGTHKANELQKRNKRISKVEQLQLESFELRRFYQVETLTQELLDFDNNGKGRLILKNHKMATGRVLGKSLHALFTAKLVQQTYAILHSNKDFKYSALTSFKLRDFIKNDTITIRKHKRKVSDIFSSVFPGFKENSDGISLAKNFLKNYFWLKDKKGTNDNFYAYDGTGNYQMNTNGNKIRKSRGTKIGVFPSQLSFWLRHLEIEHEPSTESDELEILHDEMRYQKIDIDKLIKNNTLHKSSPLRGLCKDQFHLLLP
ncbi:MAG: hypothetical protein ACJAS1_003998 [Oleiphilaceae bacterium]|jgi:hypothetical protein